MNALILTAEEAAKRAPDRIIAAEELLPWWPAVYCWWRQGRPMYVGCSTYWPQRVFGKDHDRLQRIRVGKGDHVELHLFPSATQRELLDLEQSFIAGLHPVLNKPGRIPIGRRFLQKGFLGRADVEDFEDPRRARLTL